MVIYAYDHSAYLEVLKNKICREVIKDSENSWLIEEVERCSWLGLERIVFVDGRAYLKKRCLYKRFCGYQDENAYHCRRVNFRRKIRLLKLEYE